MVNTKGRYFLPSLFCLVVGGLALQVIIIATSPLPPGSVATVMGMPTQTFIFVLLGISLPILAVEYYLFAVPVASLFLFVNRAVKAASYEMNIMNIGPMFGGRHMIRRAAAPALFSVASSTMLSEVIRGFLGIAAFPDTQLMDLAALSLMSALVVMPFALLIFMPTWVLNDSGIVTHLKTSKLDVRQCPDTQGVGRWVSSIFGGYALIAFPISMFTRFIYNPFIASGSIPDLVTLLQALTVVFGVPLFVMAFIVPVIVVNEHSQDRIRRSIGRLAIKLGATTVEKETIKKTTRVSGEGILAEEGGREIVTSAKTIDLEKKMKIEEQEAEEARKRAKARKEARRKKK